MIPLNPSKQALAHVGLEVRLMGETLDGSVFYENCGVCCFAFKLESQLNDTLSSASRWNRNWYKCRRKGICVPRGNPAAPYFSATQIKGPVYMIMMSIEFDK